MAGNWERRWQPLLDQWVMISASSAARPWSGAMANMQDANAAVHDPDCYLCPGVTRANGTHNPAYQGAYAFDNDFPSLSPEAPGQSAIEQHDPLELTASAAG